MSRHLWTSLHPGQFIFGEKVAMPLDMRQTWVSLVAFREHLGGCSFSTSCYVIASVSMNPAGIWSCRPGKGCWQRPQGPALPGFLARTSPPASSPVQLINPSFCPAAKKRGNPRGEFNRTTAIRGLSPRSGQSTHDAWLGSLAATEFFWV